MPVSRLLLSLLPVLLILLSPTPSRAGAPLERQVAFTNGAVALKGTLMTPATAGPHPVVLFLHGSGPATREGARGYAEEFVKLGIGSLFFDKRGSGQSGGDWARSSIHDLAGDARAAIAYLQKQKDVDAKKIGLWGVSQAAWVATLAASNPQDVAFMVLISGGGASPRESELFSYQRAFHRAGLTKAEEAEGMAVIEDYFRYLETGQGRAQLARKLEASRSARWYAYAPLDRILPSEDNRVKWEWVARWDPAPGIEQLQMPILLMFGDKDTDHPTELAVRKWREALAKAGNKNVTLMVFPGAGHGIRMRDSHKGPGRAPFADGYQEAMLGWLWMHVAPRSDR